MMTHIAVLVNQLEQELLAIEQNDNSNVEKCKLCIDSIQLTLIALDEYITLHPWKLWKKRYSYIKAFYLR